MRQTDPRAVGLYQRHYSAQRGDRHHGITGPGETLTLLTTDGRALFVWRRAVWLGGDAFKWLEEGIYCAIFRNEGPVLSSALVLEASALALERWPGVPLLYTWVDASRVASTNPGWCFQIAGWRKAGRSERRDLVLLVLEPEGGIEPPTSRLRNGRSAV